MTTNKPEVVAWLHEARQDSDVITDKVRYVWGTPRGSMGAYSIPLIRLADYEALQADRDQQYDMKAKARQQRDAVTAKLKALQAECEKLRAAIRRMCSVYVVDDYYDGELREERLDMAVNRAINAAITQGKIND